MNPADIQMLIVLAHCRTMRRGNCRFRPVGDELRVNGIGGSLRWWTVGDDVRSNKGDRWFQQGKVILRHGSGQTTYRKVGDYWQCSDGSRILRDDGSMVILQYPGNRLVECVRQGDELFCRVAVANNVASTPESKSTATKSHKGGGLVLVVAIAVFIAWLYSR